ncbi:adenylosuccinate lyase [Candidatus Riesia sp. GBBU]|nr:adenylosuccinate lyase [Candidatus Riesia sp. GBBU]
MNFFNAINAVSPIDGRYRREIQSINKIFSEFQLIKNRVKIEILWIEKLSLCSKFTEIPELSEKSRKFLKNIIEKFNNNDALTIKKIEKKVNHDVKAVEIFLRSKIEEFNELKKIKEFVHFACTSDDINNLSYALIIKRVKEELILPLWEKIINKIKQIACSHKSTAMLSRTHGRPATPTTLGKELINFVFRMQRQYDQFKKIKILGKINGSVGNYNAHFISYPKVDWIQLSKKFVESLRISWNPITTQIEPHDYISELLDCFMRFNTILIGFNKDIWGYISLNYFKQKKFSYEEVGSSSMPHKINPIYFEKSEGNLEISNSLSSHLSKKLPISRWQRDLTDSTSLRNLGVCFGHSIIAYNSTLNGLDRIQVNRTVINKDLKRNPEVLSEAIQTILRKYKINNSYDIIKSMVRGNTISKEKIFSFIDTIDIPEYEKEKLKFLKPKNYIGLSKKIVEKFIKNEF